MYICTEAETIEEINNNILYMIAKGYKFAGLKETTESYKAYFQKVEKECEHESTSVWRNGCRIVLCSKCGHEFWRVQVPNEDDWKYDYAKGC